MDKDDDFRELIEEARREDCLLLGQLADALERIHGQG
jgi:hypothetical protein